jgi:hypothetical protein
MPVGYATVWTDEASEEVESLGLMNMEKGWPAGMYGATLGRGGAGRLGL